MLNQIVVDLRDCFLLPIHSAVVHTYSMAKITQNVLRMSYVNVPINITCFLRSYTRKISTFTRGGLDEDVEARTVEQ